jgi:bifunctional DNA-binding transcriptional regulator/antitoxin component of YhaV-PrlF toxin-antitoxin module
MKVKVDNYYRIALPKSILDMLEINKGDELKLEYDSINKVITLNKGVMKDIKHLIKMRLKKDISKSEENFLINLLSVSEVNNDKDKK